MSQEKSTSCIQSSHAFLPKAESPPVEWKIATGLTPYPQAIAFMEQRATAISQGTAQECVWMVEHPPLYTCGTSGKPSDILDSRLPLFQAGRGGQITYHGPGQRIAYVMLNLSLRRTDLRAFVCALEQWIIDTLVAFDITAGRRTGRVGVWVDRPDKAPGINDAVAEDKIAAIGIRVRHWVSFHGISINLAPDLSHFAGIVPCGIREQHFGVTSLSDLGRNLTMAQLDQQLQRSFEHIFGPCGLAAF